MVNSSQPSSTTITITMATALLLSILPALTAASRAYPHGCLYRHPSYYTYDERDDISWVSIEEDNDELENDEIIDSISSSRRKNSHNEYYVDFRKLPHKSSPLRMPYDRYRLTRRLGAGKFSDVFEAADVRWKDDASSSSSSSKTSSELRRRKKGRMRDDDDGTAEEGSSGEGGGIKAGGYYYGESATTEAEEESDECEATEDEDDDDEEEGAVIVDPESLVVLKCLKPVSERKIRRELLVLTHCVSLPNLARVIGIVLPDSMDCDDDEDSDSDDIVEQYNQERQSSQQEVTGHSKKRKKHAAANRRRKLQREKNIGSITDAAASVEIVRENNKKTASAAAPTSPRGAKGNNSGINKNNQQQQQQQHQQQPDGTQLPALVLEHAGQKAQWFCHNQQHPPAQRTQPQNADSSYMTEYEMKYYLCHLLVALDELHAAGIMHRDVKPRNTLINRGSHLTEDDRGINEQATKSKLANEDSDTIHRQSSSSLPTTTSSTTPAQPLMLVDLGLADFYLPGKSYNVRVASRHYKSPELLIGFQYYDYAIDMWSVGCMLAGLLFRREPFFRGKDNEDQLGKIVNVLGTRDFLPYCRKCNVRLSSKSRAAIGKYCSKASSSTSSSSSSSEDAPPRSLLDNDMGRRTPWLSFVSSACPIPSPEALDLLDKLLVYDHEQRWTAREALGHSFFDDVRERVLGEVRERAMREARRRQERSSAAVQWR